MDGLKKRESSSVFFGRGIKMDKSFSPRRWGWADKLKLKNSTLKRVIFFIDSRDNVEGHVYANDYEFSGLNENLMRLDLRYILKKKRSIVWKKLKWL